MSAPLAVAVPIGTGSASGGSKRSVVVAVLAEDQEEVTDQRSHAELVGICQDHGLGEEILYVFKNDKGFSREKEAQQESGRTVVIAILVICLIVSAILVVVVNPVFIVFPFVFMTMLCTPLGSEVNKGETSYVVTRQGMLEISTRDRVDSNDKPFRVIQWRDVLKISVERTLVNGNTVKCIRVYRKPHLTTVRIRVKDHHGTLENVAELLRAAKASL